MVSFVVSNSHPLWFQAGYDSIEPEVKLEIFKK